MEGIAAAALGSLAGFVACVVLYTYFPLPANGIPWQTSGPWISILLLGVGLACFVVFLVTGLITFFNRGSDRPP